MFTFSTHTSCVMNFMKCSYIHAYQQAVFFTSFWHIVMFHINCRLEKYCDIIGRTVYLITGVHMCYTCLLFCMHKKNGNDFLARLEVKNCVENLILKHVHLQCNFNHMFWNQLVRNSKELMVQGDIEWVTSSLFFHLSPLICTELINSEDNR